jgi:hypothetical protein
MFLQIPAKVQLYKTFYGCNLQMLVMKFQGVMDILAIATFGHVIEIVLAWGGMLSLASVQRCSWQLSPL